MKLKQEGGYVCETCNSSTYNVEKPVKFGDREIGYMVISVCFECETIEMWFED